ncbi:MAG: exo-alpha-sialidase, partial [Cytophagales bacterium]|nr:exo-alpha-sialidase [Armatimonadota bacterium]
MPKPKTAFLAASMTGLSLAALGAGVIAQPISRTVVKAPSPRKSPQQPHTWKNVRIVGGGFVSGIIFHPTAKGLRYARTDIGGAYRWDTKGGQWVALTDWVAGDDWNFTGIESMAPDPSDPDRVYMAAGTYTNSWSGNGAIFRSSDQGRTWQRTDMPFKMGGNEDGRSNGERLAVDPNDGRVLFFGSRGKGLWQSVDRGVTWSKVRGFPAIPGATAPPTDQATKDPSQPIGIVFVQFAPTARTPGKPTQTIYAGVSTQKASLYQSKDGGKTWVAVPDQPVGLLPSHGALASDGSLYLSYGDQPGPNGVTKGAVCRFDTRTGVWADITPLRSGPGESFGYGGVTVDTRRPGTAIVSTIDRWSRGDEIFRTTDGGVTWKPLGPKSVRDVTKAPWLTWGREKADLGHWIGDIEIDPFDSGHVLYVTGTGIWASGDVTESDADRPTHWAVGAQGLEECVVDDIVSPSAGAHLLSVVWDIDGFRHDDLDASPPSGFFKPGRGHNTSIDAAALAPGVVVRVYERGTGGAHSADNGVTWTEFAGKPDASTGGGTIAVSADGKTFVWTPGQSGASTVYSRDRGATWAVAAGLPPRLRVTADQMDPSRFYAVDNGSGTVYASRDGGASFAARAAVAVPGGGYVRA